MKGTQVKTEVEYKSLYALCVVCGKKCLPYGYVLQGKGQVCSRACSDTHDKGVRNDKQA